MVFTSNIIACIQKINAHFNLSKELMLFIYVCITHDLISSFLALCTQVSCLSGFGHYCDQLCSY